MESRKDESKDESIFSDHLSQFEISKFNPKDVGARYFNDNSGEKEIQHSKKLIKEISKDTKELYRILKKEDKKIAEELKLSQSKYAQYMNKTNEELVKNNHEKKALNDELVPLLSKSTELKTHFKNMIDKIKKDLDQTDSWLNNNSIFHIELQTKSKILVYGEIYLGYFLKVHSDIVKNGLNKLPKTHSASLKVFNEYLTEYNNELLWSLDKQGKPQENSDKFMNVPLSPRSRGALTRTTVYKNLVTFKEGAKEEKVSSEKEHVREQPKPGNQG